MQDTIIFKWETGQIQVLLSAILAMTAAKVKALVKTATLNRAEVVDAICTYLSGLIAELDTENDQDRRKAEKWEALIDAAQGRKRTPQEKAVARIIKSARKGRFQGAFEDVGKQCICDGYRLIRLSDRLNLPAVNAKFDTTRAIGDISGYSVQLALPELSTLKKAVSAAKKGAVETGNRIHIAKDFRGKVVSIWYDFGDRLPMVDAAYLVDMLEALPACSAFCSSRSSFARIYFVSGNNDGLLVPVRKTKEYGLAPAVIETAEPATTAAAETTLETNEKPAPVAAVAETYTDTTTAAETPERATEGAKSGLASEAMYIVDAYALLCLPCLLRDRQIGRTPHKPKKERTTPEGQEATHKPPLCSASRLAPSNAIHGHDSASGADTYHKRKSRAIATTAPPIGYRFASTGKTIACKSKAPPGRAARPRRAISALPRPAPE